ncbi:uncharacterized protein BXIN_0948 [Babesia sp. Xinjiang]|uniref:uncharacterized protein n=1 Tax=Babesia sp. Xinjiang TaxID=462227 RepID=UPI000A22F396|nr:uncharacterized protein BXIN_0948 [Babesia sp. Xinjiang]ORM42085.1 hypothetical protein BXIN_0948 [Babesia sp. Xinjiang]
MVLKWTHIFFKCLLVFWLLQYTNIAHSSRQVCAEQRRRPGGRNSHLSASFLVRKGPQSEYCNQRVTRHSLQSSSREPFIKDVAAYDQFPKFAQGRYSLKNVHIDDKIIDNSSFDLRDIVSAINAIGILRDFVLLPNGELRLSLHPDSNVDDVAAIPLSSDSCISNYTLAVVQQAFNKDEDTEEWIKRLDESEFKPIDVEDLIQEAQQIDPVKERESMVQEFNTIMREHEIKKSKLEPIGWKYVPTQKLIGVYARLLPTDKCISWMFRSLPGDKPLVIYGASLKLRMLKHDQETPGQDSQPERLAWPLAQSDIHMFDNIEFKLRSFRHLQATMQKWSKRHLDSRAKDKPSQNTEANTATEIELLKPQFIEVSGMEKLKFNMLMKIMRTLDETLVDVIRDCEPVLRGKCTAKVDSHPRPLWVQILNVLINGKYFKFIPMLVFYIDHEDKYCLCTRNIILQPETKPYLWNPWKTSYAMMNLDNVPKAYREVLFADTHQFKITEKHIQHILTMYKPLEHLDISGYLSGNANPLKRAVKKIIHIEPHKQLMVNIVH